MSDGSVSGKDGPMFELAMPVLVKVKDPFLKIIRKMGPIINLELRRQDAFVIVEAEALEQI